MNLPDHIKNHLFYPLIKSTLISFSIKSLLLFLIPISIKIIVTLPDIKDFLTVDQFYLIFISVIITGLTFSIGYRHENLKKQNAYFKELTSYDEIIFRQRTFNYYLLLKNKDWLIFFHTLYMACCVIVIIFYVHYIYEKVMHFQSVYKSEWVTIFLFTILTNSFLETFNNIMLELKAFPPKIEQKNEI